MQIKHDNKDNLEFVTRHYREGAFDYRKGLDGIIRPRSHRAGIAAAITVAIALTASAIGLWNHYGTTPPAVDNGHEETTMTAGSTEARKVKIEFNNAPLNEVVKRIETAYGVTVTNLPEEQHNLTLSYEGTADELIDIINSLLGTKMEIARL